MKIGRPPIYPWRRLKVGDEFTMRTKMLTSARSMASSIGIDLGKVFQVRKEATGKIIARRIR